MNKDQLHQKNNLRAYAILLSMLREHTARALCLTYWSPTARHAEKEANPLYPVPKLMTKQELESFYYRIADWSESQ